MIIACSFLTFNFEVDTILQYYKKFKAQFTLTLGVMKHFQNIKEA